MTAIQSNSPPKENIFNSTVPESKEHSSLEETMNTISLQTLTNQSHNSKSQGAEKKNFQDQLKRFKVIYTSGLVSPNASTETPKPPEEAKPTNSHLKRLFNWSPVALLVLTIFDQGLNSAQFAVTTDDNINKGLFGSGIGAAVLVGAFAIVQIFAQRKANKDEKILEEKRTQEARQNNVATVFNTIDRLIALSDELKEVPEPATLKSNSTQVAQFSETARKCLEALKANKEDINNKVFSYEAWVSLVLELIQISLKNQSGINQEIAIKNLDELELDNPIHLNYLINLALEKAQKVQDVIEQGNEVNRGEGAGQSNSSLQLNADFKSEKQYDFIQFDRIQSKLRQTLFQDANYIVRNGLILGRNGRLYPTEEEAKQDLSLETVVDVTNNAA